MSTSSESTLARRLPAWTRIPPQQMLSLMLVVAAGVALIIGGWMYSTTPDYRVLYANLSDRDGGAVIAALQQMNVPYKFADGGGALLVPENVVHDTRLKLASQGLPKGGLNGFELMEGQRFGASQFLEQVNYQRGLEGELARSIQTLQSVQSARVHLALTKSSAFLREQPAATASVLVHLYAGRTLDPMQVAAIVHLVTNSVPGLSTRHVSVVDQNGTLLSGESNAPGSGVDKAQLKYRNDMEQGYVQRIEAILAPIVGTGNVKAQVSAELDFSEIEHAEESYKPNQKPEAASVRTQQTSESSGGGGASAAGVPGALSNQPPGPASAPITAEKGAAGTSAAASNASSSHRRDAAVTYEVDKSIRHTKLAQGRLKRLSVAVVVNDRTGADAAGKSAAKPLTDGEKEQITDLVKGVVGYDKERGDVLSVMNSAFKVREAEAIVQVPFWKQPSTIDLAKDSGKFLLIAALILFVLLKVFKPMVTSLASVPAPAPQVELLQNNAPPPSLQHAQRYESSLQTARQIAKQDPKIVANVVKDWVAGNEQ